MSGRSKNHTLKGGTSPYSLSMGVPPPRGLAASLAEFELFIHELCRFALPHSKIQSCQHVNIVAAIRRSSHAFYRYTPFLVAEFGHIITQSVFH